MDMQMIIYEYMLPYILLTAMLQDTKYMLNNHVQKVYLHVYKDMLCCIFTVYNVYHKTCTCNIQCIRICKYLFIMWINTCLLWFFNVFCERPVVNEKYFFIFTFFLSLFFLFVFCWTCIFIQGCFWKLEGLVAAEYM